MEQLKINVVLVDDELRAINRMKIVLQNFPEVTIMNEFNDAIKAIEYITVYNPDLVFLDVEMPKKTGLEMAEEINRVSLNTKIIFITSHDHYAIDGIRLNAFDYLLKPVSINALKKSLERFKATAHFNITKREIEIINLISNGLNSREIGEKLHISHNTVDTYRRNILEKTGCKNAAELIKYAVKIDLI
jgi:DNA-binding NarL/FixJ family response regulator